MRNALLINPTAMEAGLMAAARSLSPIRADAFERFASTGLPHRRIEGWKWTDFRAALRVAVPPAASVGRRMEPSIFAGAGVFEIAVVNGRAAVSGPLPEGVAVVVDDCSASLPAAALDHPMANLASAFAEQRVEIKIAGKVDQPLHLRLVAGEGASYTRLHVSLSDGAEATIIESYAGEGASFLNCATEIELGVDSALTRLLLQDDSGDGVLSVLGVVALGRNARLVQVALLFGAAIARLETRIACDGAGGDVSLSSAAALSDGRHADCTSRISFNAEGCAARQIHKSAVGERSQGVFQGKFFVSRDGQKTDSQMRANALLLSQTAEANHKPELEIYADDVACAHGSTAGALDDDAIFYMRSRGLTDQQARSLLVEAFLNEAVAGIAHVGLDECFRARLQKWVKGVL